VLVSAACRDGRAAELFKAGQFRLMIWYIARRVARRVSSQERISG